MSTKDVEIEVSERFRMPAPTLVSQVGDCPPLAFTRLRCDRDSRWFTKKARAEDAYVVHVMLAALPQLRMWQNGRETIIPPIPQTGLIACHLETEPVVGFHSSFDFLRFYISKTAIDELSDTTYGQLPEGLKPPDFDVLDPVLFHLASAVVPLLERRLTADQLLLDQLALVFHAHITTAYAGSPRGVRRPNYGGLAPWQERRAKDYLEANLSRSVALADVARTCGVSPSHFARAFRLTTGRPPHRWLIERRIEAAKAALENSELGLREIAATCGFSDASHFSSTFSKATGQTPAAWRRGRTRAFAGFAINLHRHPNREGQQGDCATSASNDPSCDRGP
ncbi:AraC family transcriptional regulator [Mesorhizobium sp. B2-4-17]|uniref:AraC family transcriptional regulator n=1 Tax=Mesorhizobium sp. B2-4-17 TaxID=2589932 RepID=UPI00112854A8|nr:AraC family transcriptional regulator [Mesorhizobium sp. B2-4-17]TPK78148.1 helix-turn-helix transcriptional regulator [Mesorhizobium sp. B2-4-17]